jgi:hypothetical protein
MSNNLGEILVIGLDVLSIMDSIDSPSLSTAKHAFETSLHDFLVTVYGNQSQSSIQRHNTLI